MRKQEKDTFSAQAGKLAWHLFSTHGYPVELFLEEMMNKTIFKIAIFKFLKNCIKI